MARNRGVSAGERKFRPKQNKKSQREDAEIKELQAIIADQAPPKGSNPLALKDPEKKTYATSRKFDELPLSKYTKDALKESKFVNLTAIQRAALPHALAERDVLGAAKTGSGKTLAFLIPVLELLYKNKWTKWDGLGALVISPTRELALQIFEELRKAGFHHEVSAGLLIGGKDVAEEAALVNGMNILVATPGRLLQHMDETPGFDASNLQILVLDEADRILDMGFAATLNAIIENLPQHRQTLLFSATQTKSVSALARLSLKDPEYVAVHEEAETPTPNRLEQAWMEVSLGDKLDVLWSFLRTHLHSRIIVFLSTCKQVRFVYESFRRLRPGTPLRSLHGRMSQYKRMGVYKDFCSSKAGVLFATDIAARGLDFPSVDWVVQFDCPEDVASYIHRVGRTARYTASGKGLLLLLPSEKEAMMQALTDARVPTRQLRQNPAKLQPVSPALRALLSKDPGLKEIAQRALVSYLRSVFLQPNKNVFDVTKLPIEEFAFSMGLSAAPKLRFLKAGGKIKTPKPQQKIYDNTETIEKKKDESDALKTSTGDREDAKDPRNNSLENFESKHSDDDSDEFLTVKRKIPTDGSENEKHSLDLREDTSVITKQRKKRMKIKPGVVSGTRMVFDDEGNAVDPLSLVANAIDSEMIHEARENGLHTGIHETVAERAAAARAEMARRDVADKEAIRALRKSKREERRAKRLAREFGNVEDTGVALEYDQDSSEEEKHDELQETVREDEFVDLITSSDEERELDASKNHKTPRRQKNDYGTSEVGAEVAHLGMIPASEKSNHNLNHQNSHTQKGKSEDNLSMSIEEQEALALHLLRQE